MMEKTSPEDLEKKDAHQKMSCVQLGDGCKYDNNCCSGCCEGEECVDHYNCAIADTSSEESEEDDQEVSEKSSNWDGSDYGYEPGDGDGFNARAAGYDPDLTSTWKQVHSQLKFND